MAVKEVSDYRKRLYSRSQNSETSFSCTVHVQGQEHLFAIFKRKMVKFSYKVLNFTRKLMVFGKDKGKYFAYRIELLR